MGGAGVEFMIFFSKSKKKQEGHDDPGSLTWVLFEPNYFKICPPV